jgi:hypothetical protein
LTVIVHRGQGEVCVYSSILSHAGCKIATGGDLEFRFSPGAVQVGESFTVSYQGRELKYVNGPQSAPEHVYLEASSGGGGGVILINWGEVCRNPIVDFVIKEPCYTLTTPDGYTLTPWGNTCYNVYCSRTCLTYL